MKAIKTLVAVAFGGLFGVSAVQAQTTKDEKPQNTRKNDPADTKNTSDGKPTGEAKKGDPKKAAALAEEGEALRKKGQVKEAFDKFVEALQLDQTNPIALRGAAWMLNSAKEYEKALNLLTLALIVEPKSSMAWREYGYAEWKLGRIKQARQSFNTAIKCDLGDLVAYDLYAQMLDEEGTKGEAESMRKMQENARTLLLDVASLTASADKR